MMPAHFTSTGIDSRHSGSLLRARRSQDCGAFFLFALLLTGCAWRPGAPDPGEPPLLQGLDGHHVPVTTSDALAQRLFDQGLTLAYAFNHQEAARSFRYAAQLDPDFAMAHWGTALVLGPNINAPMDPADFLEAYTESQRALALAPKVTPLERALIEALAQRYVGNPSEDRTALDHAYADAMRSVAERFPDSDDAATLCAEAIMDLSPWDYWTADNEPHEATSQVLYLLDSVLARSPQHPGANHLYIHAVEKGRPELGLPSAKRLESLLPGAGHMVHMPSHIYIRVGQYHDGVLSNERAVLCDQAYLTQCRQQGIYPLAYVPHNRHFLWACATLEGNREKAIRAARDLRTEVKTEMMREPGLETLQHYWITPLYAYVRFGKWDEILKEPAPDQDLLYPRAVWHYARGTALLRKSNLPAARAELDRLTELAARPELESMTIWEINSFASVTAIAREVLGGEIAIAEGDAVAGLARLRDAVAREDALAYNEPPDWHSPVRQSLGAALVQLGQPSEAEAAYREDLAVFPENGWSLFGLMQALRAQDREEDANHLEERFERAWNHADVTLTASVW